MIWNVVLAAVCGVATLFNVWSGLRRPGQLRYGAPPRPRLVYRAPDGAVIGRPTRAQWRLRRRALLEAVAACERSGEHESTRFKARREECARRIQWLIDDYDAKSPEFSPIAGEEERVA